MYARTVLGPGDSVPAARVWVGSDPDPAQLLDVVAGEGHALLCFYPFDWSPG
jgi:hypothetical protein